MGFNMWCGASEVSFSPRENQDFSSFIQVEFKHVLQEADGMVDSLVKLEVDHLVPFVSSFCNISFILGILLANLFWLVCSFVLSWL